MPGALRCGTTVCRSVRFQFLVFYLLIDCLGALPIFFAGWRTGALPVSCVLSVDRLLGCASSFFTCWRVGLLPIFFAGWRTGALPVSCVLSVVRLLGCASSFCKNVYLHANCQKMTHNSCISKCFTDVSRKLRALLKIYIFLKVEISTVWSCSFFPFSSCKMSIPISVILYTKSPLKMAFFRVNIHFARASLGFFCRN